MNVGETIVVLGGDHSCCFYLGKRCLINTQKNEEMKRMNWSQKAGF